MKSPITRVSHTLAVAFLLLIVSLAMAWGATPTVAGQTIPQEGPHHTIQGQVLTDESTPRPVQNARIIAKRVNSTEKLSTTTGADGTYTLAVPLKRSAWQVRAQKTGSTTPHDALAPNGSKFVSFFSNTNPESRTADFTFQMPNAHIVGRVLISGTNAVPNFPVTVKAIQLQGGGGGGGATGASAEPAEAAIVIVSTPIDPNNGTFDLSVPPGVYQVTVIPEDPTQYLPPAIPPVTVTGDQPTDLGDLYLTPVNTPGGLALISGKVQTPDAQPVGGVRVIGIRPSDLTPTLPVQSQEDGGFTLIVTAGTWWVAVALDADAPYMPYKLEWQTTVTVQGGETVTDVVLVVAPADATIHGTLTQGEGGAQATDACGVVAAYKAGDPSVYSFRTFTNGTFDMAVMTGTYRLVVLPDPGVNIPEGLLPDTCAPGQYLSTVVKKVPVETPGTTAITVPLQTNTATIHGQLWDKATEQPVTGWSGQVLGWNPAHSTWAAAKIDPSTGRGDLRAVTGDWLLAYRIDPGSGYKVRPGVARTNVPTGATDVDVNLPVVSTSAAVTGQVLDPDGQGVPRVVVTAVGYGTSGLDSDSALTDASGQFTLTINYGTYLLGAFGPGEIKGDKPWISPESQKMEVTEGAPLPHPVLQFRAGDATIHGRVALSSTQSTAGTASAPQKAAVWAVTRGGHTKTWVTLPMAEGDEYRLPALMGSDWLVSAAYWDGSKLWAAQKKISVDSADISLDLTLIPISESLIVQRISQAIDTAQSFYAELSDGVKLHIPAGALGDATAPGQLKKTVHLYKDDLLFLNGNMPGTDPCCPSQNIPFDPELHLISPAYTLGMVDRAGNPLTDDDIREPMILRIPYDEAPVAQRSIDAGAQGSINEGDIVAMYSGSTGNWQPFDNYVVDTESNEVVIFADQWGSYAVGGVSVQQQVFLPLTTK